MGTAELKWGIIDERTKLCLPIRQRLVNFGNGNGDWRAVEDAYEAGIGRQVFLDRYRDFKTVVPSKMGEKQLWRQFAQASGYETYPVLKRARESQAKFIKMVGDEK